MALTKPSVLPVWGETNTTSADMVQPTNSDIQTGWPLSSTPPSRQRYNWFMNYVMNAARYFARRGASDWDAAETYMTGDRIIGPDGLCYMSLQDTNLNKTPASQPTWWLRTNFSAIELQKQAATAFDDTGAANAYVITPTSPIAAYAKYQRFSFKAANANTGASTLNAGPSAASIVRRDGSGLRPGDIPAGAICDVEHDGTNFQLLNISSSFTFNQKTTDYTALSPDGGTELNFYLTSATKTLTLSAASTYGNGWYQDVSNHGGSLYPLTIFSASQFYGNGGLANASSFVLQPGESCRISYQGASQFIVTSLSNGRIRLKADTTFYVATTGSDTTGTGTSGAPWATLQYAYNYLQRRYDLAGYTATISVADGTYTAPLAASGPLVGQASPLVISGNSGTPSNVLINVTSATCFSANSGAILYVTGMKLQATGSGTSGNGILAGASSQVLYGNIVFGACANAGVYSGNGGLCTALAANFRTAGGTYHLYAVTGGNISDGQLTTLTGTPAFTGAYAKADMAGIIYAIGATFSGSATGLRANANLNGVIQTNGGGTSFFPGNSVATTTNGGQYA